MTTLDQLDAIVDDGSISYREKERRVAVLQKGVTEDDPAYMPIMSAHRTLARVAGYEEMFPDLEKEFGASAPPPLARPAPPAPASPVTVNLTIANQPADVRLEQPIHVHPPAPAPAPAPAQVIVQNQPAPVNVELTVDARPAAGGTKKVTVVRDADGQIRSAEITPENPPAGAA